MAPSGKISAIRCWTTRTPTSRSSRPRSGGNHSPRRSRTFRRSSATSRRPTSTVDACRRRDYWAWRQAAQQSINAKLSEIRAIKAWLRAHGRREQAEPSIQHLTNLFLLVDQLIKEDAVELNQAEHALVQNAGEHLRQLGAIS
jgi:predicted transcriptional regulator